jgi:hypothetical protein
MNLLKTYWYWVVILGLGAALAWAYTHPQKAAPTMTRRQVNATKAGVAQAQAETARDTQRADVQAEGARASYAAGLRRASRAATLRTQTKPHPHAPLSPAAADSALRAADSFLTNY